MVLIPVRMILLHPLENQRFDLVVDEKNITRDSVVAMLLDEFDRFGETGYYLNDDDQNYCFIESSTGGSNDGLKKIIARPHEVGVIQKRGEIMKSFSNRTFVDLFSDENIDLVKNIFTKDHGFCMVACEDEYTNPKAYENVGLWDGKPQLIYKNDKVCIEYI